MATLKTAIEKIHEDTPAKLAKDLWDCQRLFLCSFDGAPKEYKKLLAIRLKEFEHRLDLLRCRTDILLPRLPYKEKETDGDRAVRIYDWCVAAIPIWKSQEVLPKENAAALPVADTDKEIDSATKQQQWRDDAPEYMPNGAAIKMAGNKIPYPSFLTRVLQRQGNVIRWMHNKKSNKTKVCTQDFLNYLKTLKTSTSSFSEEAFEQRERQTQIDLQKQLQGD